MVVKKPQAPQVVQDYPAATIGTGSGVLALILGLLVTHGVIGSAHVGELQQWLDPLLAGALPAIAGGIVHRLVKPMSKIEAWIVHQSHGMLTDADLTRIALAVREYFEDEEQVLVGAAHPDAQAVGPPAIPTRQAGAPGGDEISYA